MADVEHRATPDAPAPVLPEGRARTSRGADANPGSRGAGAATRVRFSRQAGLLVWIVAVAAAGGAALSVDFNLFVLHAGGSPALVGALATAGSAAAALAALPAGWLSDRLGRRDFILLVGAVGGAAQLAQIAWPRPVVLLPAAWVGGAATVALGVVMAPLMAEASLPAERQAVFSVVGATALVAGVVGNLLGGWLPGQLAHLGPLAADRATLLLATGVQLLALPAVLGLPGRRQPGGGGPSPGGLRLPPVLVRLLVPEALIGAGAGLFVPFYNVFLARRLHAGTAAIGAILAVQALVTAGFTLLGPGLARRCGRVPAIAGLQLASLPLLPVMARSLWLPLVAAAGWVRSGLMNAAGPLLNALEMDAVPPQARAVANAALGMANNAAAAATAWLGGRLMQHDLALPYEIALGLYAAASASVWWLLRHLDRPGTPPPS